MNDDDKLLLARTEDMYRLCDKYSAARFSHFYNEAQADTVFTISQRVGYNTCFFGGYSDAERRIFGVFPEWQEARHEDFPIAYLQAETKFQKKLTHRDYLGTILSLGIERSKVGDIAVSDSGAYIFVYDDIADYIQNNITKIANCGVKIKRVEKKDVALGEKEYKLISCVAASMRLDAVLAAALNITRRESAMYISSGRVLINHKPCDNLSLELKEGDLLSVRGAGRIILEEKGAKTGSGRIHILLKKCVR